MASKTEKGKKEKSLAISAGSTFLNPIHIKKKNKNKFNFISRTNITFLTIEKKNVIQ